MFKRRAINNKGITVVEVVVVVTLFCVVLAAFAPRVSALVRPNTPETACLRLKENMERLKQKSAATGLPYMFVIDMDNNAAWGIQTANMPFAPNTRPLARSTTIESMYESVLRFGPQFKFLDVEFAATVKFENGMTAIRFNNGFNDHVLLHVQNADRLFTLWLQPFNSQINVAEGYWTFDDIYYQKF